MNKQIKRIVRKLEAHIAFFNAFGIPSKYGDIAHLESYVDIYKLMGDVDALESTMFAAFVFTKEYVEAPNEKRFVDPRRFKQTGVVLGITYHRHIVFGEEVDFSFLCRAYVHGGTGPCFQSDFFLPYITQEN